MTKAKLVSVAVGSQEWGQDGGKGLVLTCSGHLGHLPPNLHSTGWMCPQALKEGPQCSRDLLLGHEFQVHLGTDRKNSSSSKVSE